MLLINLKELYQLAGPTPKLTGGQGGTPRAKNTRVRTVNLLTQPLKVAHQRVSLDVALDTKRIEGFTELTVIPQSNTLRVIKLDAREMKIKQIWINGSKATNYIHQDLLYINDPKRFDDIVDAREVNLWDLYSSDFSIHQHHLLRQKLNYIFGAINCDPFSNEKVDNGNTEELAIILPESLKLELSDSHAIHTPSSVAPGGVTPLHLRGKGTNAETYTPIQVGIEYEILNPKNGVNFVCETLDKRLWHAYTVNSEYNVSTSSWVPCIDNLWERSTWSVEINVPRTIKDIGKKRLIENDKETQSNIDDMDIDPLEVAEEKESVEEEGIPENTVSISSTSISNQKVNNDDHDDDEDDDDAENFDLFVCTGDFNNTKETPHPTDLFKKIVSWSIFNPVCAHHVGWAVGCFQSTELSDFSETSTAAAETEEGYENLEEMEKDESSATVMLYFLPGQEEMARNTCIFAHKAVDFFLKEYGSFPFSSYGITFVSGPSFPFNNFAGLTVLSDKLLYPADIIEPMFTVTEDILECIAGQWSSINIVPQCFNDLWCTIGISRFMSFQFIKSLMGMNEFRSQIKRKMDQIVKEDVGKEPLATQVLRLPLSESDFSFVRLKAPIVLFILDRRMTKTDKSFGLSRVLPKLLLQAMSGDLQNGTLSTLHFQNVCEKVNRNRLETFFKQWVYGVGTPVFVVTQKFNKKRSMIEVVIRQVQLLQSKKVHPKPETFIHDSMSYLNNEQVFPIQPTFYGPMTIRVHEADGTPYEHIVDLKDTVVKFDVQYNTKHKRLKKNKDESIEVPPVFTKLGDILQSEEDIKEWNFAEWPKRDEEYIDPFEWIRVDTDFEWIAKVNVKQPDYMFGSQLQQDRDVEAQYEAIRYFSSHEKPNQIYCTALTRTIMDKRYYYGVRIAAAKALASMSRSSNKFIGLDYLLKAFRKLFCFDNSSIPVSNSFDDFEKFFLQKEIPKILGSVKDEDGNTPQSIKTLLLNLLKYNDNSSNDFQDCFYVSELVAALTSAVIPSTSESRVVDYHLEREMAAASKSKEQGFIEKVVQEIERNQKMDKWVPSYQFKVSVACIKLKIALARNNLYDLSFEDLLYLTSKKYHSDIRIMAFRGIFLLGGLKNSSVLKYFLQVCLLEMSTHYFTTKLLKVLLEAVSEAAIHGTPSMLDDPEFDSLEKLLDANKSSQPSMVVIEEAQTSEMSTRRDAFARATIKGSIQLLRRDYAIGKGLQHVLWELLHTSLISLHDRRSVFILSEVLYREDDAFAVTIRVPCVPLDELKRKIVAKNLGNGKLVIKREGRFRIQLSTKIQVVDTRSKSERLKRESLERARSLSGRSSRARTSVFGADEIAEPAPAIKAPARVAAPIVIEEPVSVVTHDPVVTSESLPATVDTISTKQDLLVESALPTDTPATRDATNPMKVRIRFRTRKLTETVSKPATSFVSVEKTQIKIKFTNPLLLQQLAEKAQSAASVEAMDVPKQSDVKESSSTEVNGARKRYIRISTRSGTVSASATPFEEETRAVQPSIGGKTIVKREPIQVRSPDAGESALVESRSRAISEVPEVSVKEETEQDAPVIARSKSQSPPEETSRSASPFSDPSVASQKRKKTKIYIHDKSKSASSPSATPDSESAKSETNNSIEEEAPKPKLKLKLNLR